MDDTLTNSLEAQMVWPLRPIMTSLNGDQSWLLSFPRPASDTGAKYYYHIVFEPWLNGPTSMWSSWIIHIALPKSVQSLGVDALHAVTLEIESLARSVGQTHNMTRPPLLRSSESDHSEMIDAILLFFHYLDHVHEPTLRLFNKRIPVIASPEAKAIVDKMNYFDKVDLITCLDSTAKTWRSSDIHPSSLPAWLTPVKCLGHHELNFVAALVWTHHADDGTEIHEAILESPHGTRLDQTPLQAFLDAEPQTIKLAMMHGLKESWAVGSMNTFGAQGGLALYRKIGGARHWVETHNTALEYSGIFMRLLKVYDLPRTIEWALEQEAVDEKSKDDKPQPVRITNGDSLVLV